MSDFDFLVLHSGIHMSEKGKGASLLLLGIYSALINVNIYVIAPNFDLIKNEFNISDFTVSLVSSSFYLMIGLSAFFWAYIIDYFALNRKKSLMTLSIISAIFNYLSSFSSNPLQLIVLYSTSGFLLGASFSIVFSLVSDYYSVKTRLLALAIWNLMAGIGSTAGYALSFLIGVAYGWREIFVIGSLATLFSALLLKFVNDPGRGASEEILASLFSQGFKYDFKLETRRLPILLARKTNRFLLIEYMAISVGWGAYIGWGLHYMVRFAGITKIQGGIVLGLISIGGAMHVFLAKKVQDIQRGSFDIKLLYAALFAAVEGSAYIILYSILPFANLSPIEGDLMEIIGGTLAYFISNPLFAGIIIMAAIGNMCGTTTKPINASTISEVNLPEEKAVIMGYLSIFELVGKSFGMALTGMISAIYGTLLFGMVVSLSFYYLGSIAWLFARKNYRYDRGIYEVELKKRSESLKGRL